jgi:hypothetical protein
MAGPSFSMILPLDWQNLNDKTLPLDATESFSGICY